MTTTKHHFHSPNTPLAGNTVVVAQSATPKPCMLTKAPPLHQHHFLLHGGEEVVEGDEEVLRELHETHTLLCWLSKEGQKDSSDDHIMPFPNCTYFKIQSFVEPL